MPFGKRVVNKYGSVNNIFYEIETLSTGLYNTGLGAQSTGGGRSPFWRKTFKNDGKFGFESRYSTSQFHRKYYFGQVKEEMKLCLMILSVPWYV
jgi:hypothetical protein